MPWNFVISPKVVSEMIWDRIVMHHLDIYLYLYICIYINGHTPQPFWILTFWVMAFLFLSQHENDHVLAGTNPTHTLTHTHTHKLTLTLTFTFTFSLIY